jgi:hypothetical protein
MTSVVAGARAHRVPVEAAHKIKPDSCTCDRLNLTARQYFNERIGVILVVT